MLVRKDEEWSADLEHDLGNLNGMCGWACTASAGSGEESRTVRGICDMRLVVRRVKVYAVPACGVQDVAANTARASFCREALGIQTTVVSMMMGIKLLD